jgi:HEAT repeat protein
MKHYLFSIFLFFMICGFTSAQNQQTEIDSLVKLLRTAGREWNNFANPLIKIGEPAVPALIKNAEDKSLDQWNRRISIMTLNQIHSQRWKEPALKILFDNNEDPILRNNATAGLRGMNLSDVKAELWEMYNENENESYKFNLANLLLTADTTLAFKAFYELYFTKDGYIQRESLKTLAQLKPKESVNWFLNGIQLDDWMTSNLAMDSLIASRKIISDALVSVFDQPYISEETKWRIIYIFGHRQEVESVPVLIEALQNESWLIHTEAAIGLSQFKHEHVGSELKALKNNSKPFVRNNVKWVLKNLADN